MVLRYKPGDEQHAAFWDGNAHSLHFASVVSFSCADGRYLRHSGYNLRCHRAEDSSTFRLDSSFYMIPERFDCPGTVSFLSLNFMRHFVIHENGVLKIAVDTDEKGYREFASFMVKPAVSTLRAGSIVTLRSLRFESHWLKDDQSQTARHTLGGMEDVGCQWKVHVVDTVEGGCVLESVANPGCFLDAHHSKEVHVTSFGEGVPVNQDWALWRAYSTGMAREVEIESMRYPGAFMDANHENNRVLLTEGRGIWSKWQLLSDGGDAPVRKCVYVDVCVCVCV